MVLFLILVATLAKPHLEVDPCLLDDFGDDDFANGTSRLMKCRQNLVDVKKPGFPNFYITDEQVHAFFRDGMVGPFNSGADPEKVDKHAAHLMKMTDDSQWSYWNPHLVYPEVISDLVTDSMVYTIKKLFGTAMLLWRTTVFRTPPGSLGTEWHQEWGAFQGEEVGENAPNLLPAGETYESLQESLVELLEMTDNKTWTLPRTTMGPPPPKPDVVKPPAWDFSIWIALTDIPDTTHSAMMFYPESHHIRFPQEKIQIGESQEWTRIHLQFKTALGKLNSTEEFFSLLRKDELLPGFTSAEFEQSLTEAHEWLINYHKYVDSSVSVLQKLNDFVIKEAATKHWARQAAGIPAPGNPYVRKIAPIKKGQYVVFSERILHASTPNAPENDERLSFVLRVTKGSTIVFPQRLRKEYQNLPEGAPILGLYKQDIRGHQSIVLGDDVSAVDPRNDFVTLKEFKRQD